MNKPKITQKTQQNILLSPKQLIKANILQLNSMMLEARLYQELELNPALEIVEPEIDIENNTENLDQESQETEFEDEENPQWSNQSNYSDNSDITSNLKNQSTFIEQVTSALRDENLSNDELIISEHIIGNLDDQGYLSIDSELISDKLNIRVKIYHQSNGLYYFLN